MGFQAMQSVKVIDEALEHVGQAGYVVEDNTKLVNGLLEGEVDVRIDSDGQVYTFNVTALQAL